MGRQRKDTNGIKMDEMEEEKRETRKNVENGKRWKARIEKGM